MGWVSLVRKLQREGQTKGIDSGGLLNWMDKHNAWRRDRSFKKF